MKNTAKGRRRAVKSMFLTAAILLASSGAALAQGMSLSQPTSDAMQHCGCDSKAGVEMYVQNIINDAQQRGMSCDTAKIHAFACITSYCSICKEHPGIMENCIKMGADYFAASPGFCLSSELLSAR